VVDYSTGEQARQLSQRLVHGVPLLGDQDHSTELPTLFIERHQTRDALGHGLSRNGLLAARRDAQ
jgi:hypothetical protein